MRYVWRVIAIAAPLLLGWEASLGYWGASWGLVLLVFVSQWELDRVEREKRTLAGVIGVFADVFLKAGD